MGDATLARARDNGPIVLGFLLAALAVWVRSISEGLPDSGDAVTHYQFARYVWKHAEPLLSGWGKPVFTLLASPFAQLGLWGMALFTALCAACTIWMIGSFVGRTSGTWRWFVPVALMFAPQYAHTVMAGLTEPLFGLLSVIIVIWLMEARWTAALALASFLPYTRPEHVVLTPLVVGVALVHKQWRALPWVLLGTVVYAIASTILFHDPLKVLLDDPYTGVDTYGHGTATHFFEHIDDIIGAPLRWATYAAVVGWVVLWWKDRDRRKANIALLLLTLLPAVGILLLHAYAWWKGGHGSLGLWRVLATGVPLLVLFITCVLARIWERSVPKSLTWNVIAGAAFVTYAAFAFAELRARLPMPFTADAEQRTILRVADVVKPYLTRSNRLYYLDPLLGACCGMDLWDTDHAHMLSGPHAFTDDNAGRPGDMVVWDTHFCPGQGGIPLDALLHNAQLERLGTYKPDEGTGGNGYEMDIFRFTDHARPSAQDTLPKPIP